MIRLLQTQFPGAFYHIVCRGIEQRKIYMDGIDYMSVSQLRRRLLEHMGQDKSIKEKYYVVERAIRKLCSK